MLYYKSFFFHNEVKNKGGGGRVMERGEKERERKMEWEKERGGREWEKMEGVIEKMEGVRGKMEGGREKMEGVNERERDRKIEIERERWGQKEGGRQNERGTERMR